MDKQQLKPCPFCGQDTPELERLGTPRQSCIVLCGNCGCRHESSDEGEHNGASWNDRAPAPGVDAAEPVAYLIDWPDEPELGHYFAEEPTDKGRCRALVLAEAAPSPAASADEWMAEAEKLADYYGDECHAAARTGFINKMVPARAALLAHLRKLAGSSERSTSRGTSSKGHVNG